jgi:hypothetical protein
VLDLVDEEYTSAVELRKAPVVRII